MAIGFPVLAAVMASIVPFMLGSGCSSTPPVKTQAYAKLPNQRVFEDELRVVWPAIERTFRDHKVTERDPEDVGEAELKKLSRMSLRTDWVYGKSRDKYQEYSINGTPRKKYLQTRFHYEVVARAVMGGTEVTVSLAEEIEKLNADGSSSGYSRSEQSDSSRAHEILERIRLAILSAAP